MLSISSFPTFPTISDDIYIYRATVVVGNAIPNLHVAYHMQSYSRHWIVGGYLQRIKHCIMQDMPTHLCSLMFISGVCHFAGCHILPFFL